VIFAIVFEVSYLGSKKRYKKDEGGVEILRPANLILYLFYLPQMALFLFSEKKYF